jgi:hypothetical protein
MGDDYSTWHDAYLGSNRETDFSPAPSAANTEQNALKPRYASQLLLQNLTSCNLLAISDRPLSAAC